jgi:hypothetical protein
MMEIICSLLVFNLGRTISSYILNIRFLKKPLAEVRRDEGM